MATVQPHTHKGHRMNLRERLAYANANARAVRDDINAKATHTYEGVKLSGDTLTIKGQGSWPVAHCEAVVDHGANLQGRLTVTRLAVTGPFAFLIKKGRNKVYLAVATPDTAHTVELKAKHEGDARAFADKVNTAARKYRG